MIAQGGKASQVGSAPSDGPASRPPGAATPGAATLGAATLGAVTSRALLAGRRVLVIQHGCEQYRLQLTRGGKLILTK